MYDESEFPWLETLLVLSIVALVLQLFPWLLTALDFRGWPWYVWSGLCLIVIIALIFVREYQNRSS
jgi:predicted membrane channel-forming protein YqfA (hemolysin III family)